MPVPAIVGLGVGAAVGAALRSAVGWLITAGSRLLSSRLGSWIAAAMVWLGISFAANEYAIEPILEELAGYMSAQSGVVLEWLGYLQVDQACTMILSAVATRYGMTSARVFLSKR